MMKQMEEMLGNIVVIKCSDEINNNNINIIFNKIVDQIIDNKNNERNHKKLLIDKEYDTEVVNLRKKKKNTTTDEIINLKENVKKTIVYKKGCNLVILSNINILEEWCHRKYSGIIYDNDVYGNSSYTSIQKY